MSELSARYMSARVALRMYDFQPVEARMIGSVLFSDHYYWRHSGPRRYFWLLDQGVQIVYEPFGWRAEWYVDLVAFDRREGADIPLYVVSDRYLDVVVEGMGPTYRLIDLDELATALDRGEIQTAAAGEVLTAAQEFLDTYLHRGATFPPDSIRALFAADHQYPDWARTPVSLRETAPA